ncbi:type VI secretion system baseplate subunit TssK [Massilia horti]|uniref:Type VI secretion system baseplate subunit TssK n=1 Tax=Massilia horti TaxID=2562153 RepID=A0A4Y9SMQ1_9BURK|nr:type VI secretion system baseplate subunit TssK [Massilia horti]TFW27721.1 type VI secretion system baseplate subunit TssK [Massilia horti]
MSQHNRVLWSEGLFVRPHHFQQQDRYHEHLLEQRFDSHFAYGFGFTELQVDRELLKLGKLGLAAAAGIMPDGTPFRVPDDAPLPQPLDVGDEVKDAVVSLCLPLRRPGMADATLAEGLATDVLRWHGCEFEVRDALAEHDAVAVLKAGTLNLRLRLAADVSSAQCDLPLARVREKRADGGLVLDDEFIPVSLDVRVSARLFDYVNEVAGLVRHRAAALAARVAQPGGKGVAEFADFLLLQLCNRVDPLFTHLGQRARLHPEHLYGEMLMLAGELASFARRDRRAVSFQPYQHRDPEASFRPVIEQIRQALTAVLDQTAIAIPLADKGRGAFLGEVRDVQLLRGASFVLAVSADMPSEQLRSGFPTQIKIGPPDKLRDLVMSHLPGIATQALPVAPRQLPYHAGYTYFALDRQSEFWKGVEAAHMLALHVAGDFPGLALQLWAVRDAV